MESPAEPGPGLLCLDFHCIYGEVLLCRGPPYSMNTRSPQCRQSAVSAGPAECTEMICFPLFVCVPVMCPLKYPYLKISRNHLPASCNQVRCIQRPYCIIPPLFFSPRHPLFSISQCCIVLQTPACPVAPHYSR